MTRYALNLPVDLKREAEELADDLQLQGAVHLVNPKGGTIMGRAVSISLAEVPDPVELAALIVPAASMSIALADYCNRSI